MRPGGDLDRHQKVPIFAGLLLFGLTLTLLQLWLFVSVCENAIARRYEAAIPAALASIVILLINVWMLVGVSRIDRSG